MPTPKKRFTLDLEPEMQRRLKVAAALKGISMRRYCIDAIEGALIKDPTTTTTGRGLTKKGFDQLIALRDEIFQGRKSFTDSVDLIREAREQRTEELERRSRN